MKKELKSMIERFSFAQMTSNENGKTSASGTMGVLISFIGTLCFLLGCIDKMFLGNDIDVITQSIIFVGIGVGLLGYRKSRVSVEAKAEPKAEVSPEVKNEQLGENVGSI